MNNTERLIREWSRQHRRRKRVQQIAIVVAAFAVFAMAAGIWWMIWTGFSC